MVENMCASMIAARYLDDEEIPHVSVIEIDKANVVSDGLNDSWQKVLVSQETSFTALTVSTTEESAPSATQEPTTSEQI